jgi:hypothetical protein
MVALRSATQCGRRHLRQRHIERRTAGRFVEHTRLAAVPPCNLAHE